MRLRKHAVPKLGWKKKVNELLGAMEVQIEYSMPVNSRKDFERLRKLNSIARAKFK